MPTSTLNLKGSISPREALGLILYRFSKRLALVFVGSWLIVLLMLSGFYVWNLIHPPCPPSAESMPGYESVKLVTATGIALRGWWRAPENGTAVVLLGGHGANRDTMLPEAGILADHGFGVLTLDYRSCAGRVATLGARETEELQTGLQYLQTQPGVQRSAVMGFSAGGVAAIRTAARDSQISAVIAMGNYANLWDEIANSNAPPLSLEWQVERVVAGMIGLIIGEWPASVSPVDDLCQVQPRPVFLIHGEKEAAGNHAQAQADAAGQAAELWIVPGAGHGEYLKFARQEFERRIVRFLESAAEP